MKDLEAAKAAWKKEMTKGGATVSTTELAETTMKKAWELAATAYKAMEAVDAKAKVAREIWIKARNVAEAATWEMRIVKKMP